MAMNPKGGTKDVFDRIDRRKDGVPSPSDAVEASVPVNVWIPASSDIQPKREQRVLVYSPKFEGLDSTMVYRIVVGQFVKLADDAEFWMVLEFDDNNVLKGGLKWYQ